VTDFKWLIVWAVAWVIGFGIKFYMDRRVPKPKPLPQQADDHNYKFEGTGPKDG
jgi:hypothetical protein